MTTTISVVEVQADGATVDSDTLEPENDDCPICGNEDVVRGSAAFPALVDCPACFGR